MDILLASDLTIETKKFFFSVRLASGVFLGVDSSQFNNKTLSKRKKTGI